MKDKLTLQDIVDLLAKKNGLSKKDTDAFFREFLSVITDNIFNNELVKVKDFGTFKLTRVNSRESVDVNTGEKIEIPAHYKLSFLPDRILKELVNKPFSQFKTELLADAVSFDSIEESEEPIDSPEDEDTSDDEVEVIRHPKVKELLHDSEDKVKRQKEDITSKIESIRSSKKDSDDEKAVISSETKSKPENITPPSPYVFSYSYTSSSKEEDSETITIVVPSDKTTIASKDEEVSPIQKEKLVDTKEEVSAKTEKQEPVSVSEKDSLNIDDLELDSDVPLNINKVQEKIDQLRDAIEALEKISWQSEVPENALSTKPSVDEADIYNQDSEDKVESHSEPLAHGNFHDETEEDESSVEEDEYEDVSDEIKRVQMDNDLLKSLVAVDEKESPSAQDDSESDVDNQSYSTDDDGDDDDLDFFDYNKQSEKKKRRKHIVLIVFLLGVIGVGGYHFSKLLEHKVEYENYKGYYPALTEGDTLPNAQIVQNLIDDLTLSDDTDDEDTVVIKIEAKPIEPKATEQSLVEVDDTKSKVAETNENVQITDSVIWEYDKIISENLRIRVVNKGAYLKGLPVEGTSRHLVVENPKSTMPSTPAIPATAKIGQGATLRNMAGKYYGHGIYWVYIFEENKDRIKDFDNVPAGLEVRLPNPKKYGINSKDSKSLDDARRREQALFSSKQ